MKSRSMRRLTLPRCNQNGSIEFETILLSIVYRIAIQDKNACHLIEKSIYVHRHRRLINRICLSDVWMRCNTRRSSLRFACKVYPPDANSVSHPGSVKFVHVLKLYFIIFSGSPPPNYDRLMPCTQRPPRYGDVVVSNDVSRALANSPESFKFDYFSIRFRSRKIAFWLKSITVR